MPTLTPEQQREARRRRGDAILWTILFLGAFATVDAAALVTARSVWRRLAPAAGRDLWDAPDVADPKGLLDLPSAASRYRFNADLVRFVVNGRTVVPAAVKQQVATFTAKAAEEARAVTQQMTAGTLTVAEWQTRMADHVKAVHVAAFVIAQGGAAQVTPADAAALQELVLVQLRFLLAFATATAAGTVSDAKAVARAAQYDLSANGTFESSMNINWQDIERTGVQVQARNVLAAGAEHCRADLRPGCVEETERGWVDRAAMSTPGQRECGPLCLCRVDYRRKPS